jgi:hypothetical protein
MKVLNAARAACLLATALLFCSGADAQLFRAYVSSSGNDANPCTLTAPCRLLPAALTAVQDSGEIWMLDSANYNTGTVTINKSVSILAVPGVVGSVVSTGGTDAIDIATVAVKVSLRNLVFAPLGSPQYGINFSAGASLNVNDCVFNYLPVGIATSATGTVNVRDTIVRASTAGIIVFGPSQATIERVQFVGGQGGIGVYAGAHASIADSHFSQIQKGVLVLPAGGAADAVIRNSTFSDIDAAAVLVQTTGSGDVAQVTATGNTISHAGLAAFSVIQATSSTATIFVDGNTVNNNQTAFHFLGGTIYSTGTNSVRNNVNDTFQGSLTPASGM